MSMTAGKRLFDISLALPGLLALSPLLLVIAAVVKLGDRGPAFFSQVRMGQAGRPIRIWKFRTMSPRTEHQGLGITAANDRRITPVGRWLRRSKLDELPQLWNVIIGSMSLVGPRPELPVYLAWYPAELRPVLELRAGITDIASLYFRDEERLLAAAPNPEEFYRHVCLPIKLRMSLVYGQHRSVADDFRVLCRTLIPTLPWRTLAERLSPDTYLTPFSP